MQFNYDYQKSGQKTTKANDLTSFSSTSFSSPVFDLPVPKFENNKRYLATTHSPNLRSLYEYDIPSTMMISNNILHTDKYETQRKQEAITHPFLHVVHKDNSNTNEVEVEPVLSSEAAVSQSIDNSAVLIGMSFNNDTKDGDEAAMVLNKRVKTRKRERNLDFSSINYGDAPVNKLQRRNEFSRNDAKPILLEPSTTKQKARNTADSNSFSLSSKKTMSPQNIHSNNILIPALQPMFYPLYYTNRIHSVNFNQTEIRKTPAPVLNVNHTFSTKTHSAGSINRIHSVHPFSSETQNNNTTTCNVPNSNNASSGKYKEKTNHVDANLKALATLDSRTRTNYLSLVSFKEKYGNCNVPYRFSENPILGQWVSNQRYQYDLLLKKDKRSTISLELKQLLDYLGFEWNAGKAVWDEKFLEVKRALKRVRNSTDSEIEIFNKWLMEQRNEFILFHRGEESKLTAIQAEKLASIGLGYLIADEK